jgi:hypothetical protein
MKVPDGATDKSEGVTHTPDLVGHSEPMFRLLFERSADAMSLFDPETGRVI